MITNGPLMARRGHRQRRLRSSGRIHQPLTRLFAMERVTGIEPAWPAWKTSCAEAWLGVLPGQGPDR